MINNAPMPFAPCRKLALTALLALACSGAADGDGAAGEAAGNPVALVIHGGAGTLLRADFSAEREAEYRAALTAALEAGRTVLERGGSALDAVETAIRQMEDDPLFNAGRGAVFTADGRNELDASIMDGATGLAGAVAGVTTVRHPISAARAVMERTEHVLLAGGGAEEFARTQGLEMVEPKFFWTERRWQALERAREKARVGDGESSGTSGAGAAFGTVGAVALDRRGRIAAGTSTGGMTNKKHGRIGDSPIIGAGTYARAGCGVSATGHGEYFIRHAVAFDICARLSGGATVREAADQLIHGVLDEAGGTGGVIVLDGAGNAALVFNTDGMYRGALLAGGEPRVAIFKDD